MSCLLAHPTSLSRGSAPLKGPACAEARNHRLHAFECKSAELSNRKNTIISPNKKKKETFLLQQLKLLARCNKNQRTLLYATGGNGLRLFMPTKYKAQLQFVRTINSNTFPQHAKNYIDVVKTTSDVEKIISDIIKTTSDLFSVITNI